MGDEIQQHQKGVMLTVSAPWCVFSYRSCFAIVDLWWHGRWDLTSEPDKLAIPLLLSYYAPLVPSLWLVQMMLCISVVQALGTIAYISKMTLPTVQKVRYWQAEGYPKACKSTNNEPKVGTWTQNADLSLEQKMGRDRDNEME